MTGFNRPRNSPPIGLTNEAENQILALWCGGRDTLDIAREMALPESEIANRLPKILERYRFDREWERRYVHVRA